MFGLDSSGGVLWSKSLNIQSLFGVNDLLSAKAGMRLSTDGGVQIVGSSPISSDVSSLGLWVSKIPAKNGQITLKPGLDNNDTPISGGACVIALSDLAATVSNRVVSEKDWVVTSQNISVPVSTMTP